ncbi:MAG: universal stress protein [Pseudomonadota bacterium]
MEKKILVAVDNSRIAGCALDYACHASCVIRDLVLVLFHVRPQVSGYLTQEAKTSHAARQDLDLVTNRQMTSSTTLLEKFKQDLVKRGIPESAIETVSRPYGKGVSAEILHYAMEKRLDAIVAGRRGLSGIQAFYLGSVSNNLIQQGKVTPTWIVGDRVSLKNILFAVDGSENSLRALDHLAFMLKGAVGTRLSLVHVRPRLRDFCEIDFNTDEDKTLKERIEKSNKAHIDHFYDKARAILTNAGITDQDYDIRIRDVLMDVGATIAEEAKDGGYDTIVMGRRGIKGQIFTGSTTQQVLNQVTDRAIWIVP